jgi:hypothetical protein
MRSKRPLRVKTGKQRGSPLPGLLAFKEKTSEQPMFFPLMMCN